MQRAHERRRIVLTGGPGAGKTALLELIRQSFCSHVTVLPEAASIVFGGGWDGHPRRWLIESSADFLDKAARALDVLRGELPECCRGHEVPSVRDRVHQHLSGGQSPNS